MTYTYDEAAAYEAYLARLPEDGRARLQAPRAEDFTTPKGFTHAVCHLKATDPISTPGRFLAFDPRRSLTDRHDPSDGEINWFNMAESHRFTGGGMGFPDITERPRIKASYPAPPQLRQIWPLARFFVASKAVCDLLREYDADAIATADIDWTFGDGARLDGYVFLDIKASRYVCDFFRSDIHISQVGERRYLNQRGHCTLRADIPQDAHIFRDALDSSRILVSRELAQALETRSPGECQFWDVQAGQEVPLALERIRQERSIFKRHVADASQLHDLHQALDTEIRPLVRAGEFLACEQALRGLLNATDPSPYHFVCDLEITNPIKTVASFLVDFAKQARGKAELVGIYCEMNDFTINTDLWFFGPVGLLEIGSLDDLDWLDGYYAEGPSSMVITGLEPLQKVFADSRIDRERGFERARILCEALVIVKFQRLLHEARPSMKKVDLRLFANAHDFGADYLAEIPSPPKSRGWFGWR